MKFMRTRDAVARFKENETHFNGCGGGERGGDGGGAVVVVGVKLDDCKSKELLTWALVKVAQSGDRVIALHVLDPDSVYEEDKKGTLLSLVKTFDSVLAAYEGFCNLKQVDLKFKVCRGRPVRNLLAHEVKSCGATSLILGPSEVPHTIRSSVSVAKSCAKNLPKNVSVIAVDNGKILFQRRAVDPDLQGFDVAGKRCKRRKILGKSPLSLPPSSTLRKNPCSENVDNSMALVPVTTNEKPESKSGWALLRRVFIRSRTQSDKSSVKNSSIKRWIPRLPKRQSSVTISPDHNHSISDNDYHSYSDLDEEKGAIIVVGSDLISAADSNCSKILPKELEGLSDKYSSTCRVFSYQELLSATCNFMPENLIGKGGTSRVYRGCLPDGTQLAVKILKSSRDVLQQFVSEIEIITALNHTNIISLFGFCFEDNNLLLVYDLLSRGSLEENLHGTQKSGNPFGWQERYKVAVGVAEALDHLHNASGGPIIHRDVKSSNILLSDDFEPQLSDFGLATLASNSSCHMDSLDIAGTFGYLAPEYFMHGRLNEKVDVYAYGVVLLELLSGRKPIENGNSKGQGSLVMWAKQILKAGKISKLLDPGLNDSYDEDQFERMVLAATLCLRQAPQFRPNMSLVVKLLKGDPEVVNWAEQQINASEEVDAIDDEQSPTKIQSFLNLALLNLGDDSLSSSSTQQMISVDDYLQGRWSRTSSFD